MTLRGDLLLIFRRGFYTFNLIRGFTPRRAVFVCESNNVGVLFRIFLSPITFRGLYGAMSAKREVSVAQMVEHLPCK